MNKNFIQKRTFIRPFALITLFFLPFLLCSKANAVDYNVSLTPTGRSWVPAQNLRCETYPDGVVTNANDSGMCLYIGDNPITIRSMYTSFGIPFETGNYYQTEIYFLHNSAWNSSRLQSYQMTPWNIQVVDDAFDVAEFKHDFTLSTFDMCESSTIQAIGDVVYGQFDYFCLNANLLDVGKLDTISKYTITLRSRVTRDDIPFAVGRPRSGYELFKMSYGGIIKMDTIKEFKPVSDPIQKAEQETQEATDEGQQNADSAEAQNEQASTNIVGIVSKVVGAFNTPPGACSIPIVASGVDLGNVNFCTGKPPFWTQLVGGVGSLILVYACYRVALNMFNLFISLTVFAQGGKSKGSNG